MHPTLPLRRNVSRSRFHYGPLWLDRWRQVQSGRRSQHLHRRWKLLLRRWKLLLRRRKFPIGSWQPARGSQLLLGRWRLVRRLFPERNSSIKRHLHWKTLALKEKLGINLEVSFNLIKAVIKLFSYIVVMYLTTEKKYFNKMSETNLIFKDKILIVHTCGPLLLIGKRTRAACEPWTIVAWSGTL